MTEAPPTPVWWGQVPWGRVPFESHLLVHQFRLPDAKGWAAESVLKKCQMVPKWGKARNCPEDLDLPSLACCWEKLPCIHVNWGLQQFWGKKKREREFGPIGPENE